MVAVSGPALIQPWSRRGAGAQMRERVVDAFITAGGAPTCGIRRRRIVCATDAERIRLRWYFVLGEREAAEIVGARHRVSHGTKPGISSVPPITFVAPAPVVH